MNDIMTGMYRHYGGGMYVVLGIARNSTNGPLDGERVVVYYSLKDQRLYVRELGEFIQKVEWPDGKLRPRFDLLME